MGVGQLSESDAVDALRLPFYSSSHPTGSHGWRNQFDLGNPDLIHDGAHERQHELLRNPHPDPNFIGAILLPMGEGPRMRANATIKMPRFDRANP